jgi:hypothetical protein
MSLHVCYVNFPDGREERQWFRRVPVAEDTLNIAGTRYMVEEVEHRLDKPEDQNPPPPIIKLLELQS